MNRIKRRLVAGALAAAVTFVAAPASFAAAGVSSRAELLAAERASRPSRTDQTRLVR